MNNAFIYVPALVWLMAQFVKFLIAMFAGRTDIRMMVASGGMPSGHTSVVISLMTVSYLLEGVNSPIFGFSAILAAIVIYDALGVRRAAGIQAKVLNRLLQDSDLSSDELGEDLPLKENIGHKLIEVIGGVIFGFGLSCLILYQDVPQSWKAYWFGAPTMSQVNAFLSLAIIFAAITAANIVLKRVHQLQGLHWLNLSLALMMIFLGFIQKESIAQFDMRVFNWIGIGLSVISVVYYFYRKRQIDSQKLEKTVIKNREKDYWKRKLSR
ncbi:divergent PAP2 family protein [Candidatus Saccharibacteria bacterium]|nr:divergent PAP2 family protein [Candidatus Saccharibacteria bacterium]